MPGACEVIKFVDEVPIATTSPARISQGLRASVWTWSIGPLYLADHHQAQESPPRRAIIAGVESRRRRKRHGRAAARGRAPNIYGIREQAGYAFQLQSVAA